MTNLLLQQLTQSTSSTTNPDDDEQVALWVSIVAMANENVENGINSDIVDSSSEEWLDLQSNYNLNAEGVYGNDESLDAFFCMVYTGGSEDEDEKSNNSEFQEHSGDLDDSVVSSNLCA